MCNALNVWQSLLRAVQVAESVRVTAAYGALLKVPLQDVAARKGVLAKQALIWSIACIYAKSAYGLAGVMTVPYVLEGGALNA